MPGEQIIEEFKKGDAVKAKVLDVDIEKERISLGIKQLDILGAALKAREDIPNKGANGTTDELE